MKRIALAFGLLLLGAGAAPAASFDCATATAPDERAVCGSMALSDLDVRLSTLFEVATHLVAMGQRGDLQDGERRFLAERAACKSDAACIAAAYRTRIGQVETVLKAIYQRGPF